jgi:hypothetical protein
VLALSCELKDRIFRAISWGQHQKDQNGWGKYKNGRIVGTKFESKLSKKRVGEYEKDEINRR